MQSFGSFSRSETLGVAHVHETTDVELGVVREARADVAAVEHDRSFAVEHIVDISSRLIVNQAALKLKREKIVPILDAIAGVVGA